MPENASPPGSPKSAPSHAKKRKQQTLKQSLQAPRPSPSTLPVQVSARAAAALGPSHTQEFDAALDRYCQFWGDKCDQESNVLLAGRDDLDLDARALHVVTCFNNAFDIASAHKEAVPPKFLEGLVLVMRNDCIHQYSNASRAAHKALRRLLRARPYTRVERYGEQEGRAAGQPYVLIDQDSVWLPLTEDRNSFTSKYILIPDMSLAGRNYKADRSGAQNTTRRGRGSPWLHPLDLFLHCIDKAIHSAEVDFNGDLELLHYLIEVMDQDTNARLAVHTALAERPDAQTDAGSSRRASLLTNSLVWRIYSGSFAGSDAQLQLVRGLVQLIAIGGNGSTPEGDDEEMAAAEEEPEDDAPAGACVFTRSELAALAARLLNMLLQVYGAAEASGAFLSTGKHRSASTNHRMALDLCLLDAFWSQNGLCKGPDGARALLRALAPRDTLRMLGLLAAQKFAHTYDASALGTFGRAVGDLVEYMHTTHSMMTSRASDIDSFFEVDLCPVLASLHREVSRAIKTYKTIDHLAVMVGAIVAAVHALTLAGKSVPTGTGGMQALHKELAATVEAIAEAGTNKSSEGPSQLSQLGMCDLLVASMTIEELRLLDKK